MTPPRLRHEPAAAAPTRGGRARALGGRALGAGALRMGALALALAALLVGCAAPRVYQAQQLIRSDFASVRQLDARVLLERCAILYRDNDRVLYDLERATILHFNRDFGASTRAFHRAERSIEKAYTRSISRGIASVLVNDLQLAYDGEAYEDVYVNALKSLNFLHQGDREGALVEARRMAHKLGLVEARYRGLADALSHADTTSLAETDAEAWAPRDGVIENSALARYLATVLLAKQGEASGARIEHAKLLAALRDQGHPNPPGRLARLRQPEAYNTLLVAFSGRAPTKRERTYHIRLEDPDVQFDIALPELVTYRSRAARVRAVAVHEATGDTVRAEIPLVEDMQAVAASVYRAKEPIIRARAVARMFVKTLAVEAGEEALERKDRDGWASVVGFVGRTAATLTERADTRAWQTMPGRAHVAVARLTPGTHHVRFDYLDGGGTLLFSETETVEVAPGADALALAESLYWK